MIRDVRVPRLPQSILEFTGFALLLLMRPRLVR